MMNDNILNEEALNLVSGGVLKEGWQDITGKMMAMYKGKFGDAGKAKLITIFTEKGVGGDGPLEEKDIPVIIAYINDNWDSTPAMPL